MVGLIALSKRDTGEPYIDSPSHRIFTEAKVYKIPRQISFMTKPIKNGYF